MPEQLAISGVFDVATQGLLRAYLNENWAEAGYRTAKLSGSAFNAAHFKALQTFLNAKSLGGPTLLPNGEETSDTIKVLRKFLHKHWDLSGFRPKKLALTGKIDPGFAANTGTVMALQYFLNFFLEYKIKE